MATTTQEKKLAVVTGASSGIGYELAKQFALNGFDLIIAAEGEQIEKAAAQLEPLGAATRAVQVDLATEEGVRALYDVIRSAGRPVDAIALNAGVGVGGAFATQTSLDEELRLIALNVRSTVQLAKLVISDMVTRGQGRVLFVSSIAAIMPTPFEAVYGASKAFILSFSSSLHSELKGTGVSVTALMPGPTETNFFHRAHMDDTWAGTKGLHENYASHVALQGFRALMAGEERVVSATLKTKLQAALARFLPESVKAVVHRKMSEPGTAQKSAS